MTWKHLFGSFLEPDRLHFAAHSHHLWPDVTADAHQQAWQDARTHVDAKWDVIFDAVIPETQRHIAGRLCLPDEASIAVAPNTHELVGRLMSSLPTPARIVTTDGEFHSFSRQIRRWVEAGRATIAVVEVEPFHTFPDRFAAMVSSDDDLVYLSHVFFDSGYAVADLGTLVAALPEGPEVVIDGYHGFMAIPTDLAGIADRAFYVAGGYKYAMAGEGACFMHCPPDRVERPVDTGWFAGFGALTDKREGEVGYAGGGGRFLGATFDPTGLYRFNAVQRMLDVEGIGVAAIHAHVKRLQAKFVEGVDGFGIVPGELMPRSGEVVERGHFLTYRTDDAGGISRALADRGVVTDHRGDRLRFGFGLYHDDDDVDRLFDRLRDALDHTRRQR